MDEWYVPSSSMLSGLPWPVMLIHTCPKKPGGPTIRFVSLLLTNNYVLAAAIGRLVVPGICFIVPIQPDEYGVVCIDSTAVDQIAEHA